MANQKNIEATYDYMDDIFQESLGANADKLNMSFILKSLTFKTEILS